MADFLLNNPKLQSSLDANTNSIVNVVDPTLDQDAATKKYTDDADALLVPYTGATGDVDLGANDLTTTGTLGAGATTLDSLKTTGGRVVTTTRYTTTQAIPVTDHAVFCDTDDGAFTVTLPAGVDGQEFFITNCGSGGFALTIACNGAETINGDATQLIYDAESVHVVYETTEGWRIF